MLDRRAAATPSTPVAPAAASAGAQTEAGGAGEQRERGDVGAQAEAGDVGAQTEAGAQTDAGAGAQAEVENVGAQTDTGAPTTAEDAGAQTEISSVPGGPNLERRSAGVEAEVERRSVAAGPSFLSTTSVGVGESAEGRGGGNFGGSEAAADSGPWQGRPSPHRDTPHI